MSARSRYGSRNTPTNKRFRSPRITTAKNYATKPQVTYDYDAAISQPDVPNLLDRKKIGRGVMVSGVTLKKRAAKIRLKEPIMTSKNFQKRSQEFKIKSIVQKTVKARSSNNKNVHHVKKTLASTEDNKYIDEKENVTNNGITDDDNLSNFIRVCVFIFPSPFFLSFAPFNVLFSNKYLQTKICKPLSADCCITINCALYLEPNGVNDKNVFYKDATKETCEDKNDGNNEIVEEEIIDERIDNSENVTARSLVQAKGSKIPRAKIPIVHTFYEFHPVQYSRKNKIN
ncbi:uncharacterized protein LOC143429269 [Xylocopa sonorina]|uniref:uncharacterized protein LOC143429269 n=1 Tax=Xylocopa sonorina TaxID=1818115 RepID=UPI00403B1076